MDVILNIGLNSDTLGSIETNTALQALSDNGFFVHGSQVFNSDTEPTLVVTGRLTGDDSVDNTKNLYRVAVLLGQDCIAVYSDRLIAFGALIGPRAAAWGDFNPEFFVMPDGSRLATPVAKAA